MAQACCLVEGAGQYVLVEWLACVERSAHRKVCSHTQKFGLEVPGRSAPAWFQRADGNLEVIL